MAEIVGRVVRFHLKFLVFNVVGCNSLTKQDAFHIVAWGLLKPTRGICIRFGVINSGLICSTSSQPKNQPIILIFIKVPNLVKI